MEKGDSRVQIMDISENGKKDPSKTSGCYLSKFVGFLIFLLIIGMCVATGLIVYYTKTLDCSCSDVPITDDSAMEGGDGSTDKPPPEPEINVRLPDTLMPEHYNIRLRPDIYTGDPDTFTFTGSVQIYLKCVQSTNVITVHTRMLTIDETKTKVLNAESGESLSITSVKTDDLREFYLIYVKDNLEEDSTYIVEITYSGPIKDDLAGIYYSTYDVGGTSKYMLASQMQATDARKVFPCLDEPALKATFNSSMERKRDMLGLSNTAIYRTDSLADDWVVDHYHTTPKMSTYLLAYSVGDLGCLKTYTSNNKLVEVCARHSVLPQAEYAKSIATPIQEYFETYYGLPYPLSKTTHLAVPDFGAGAMENWGLIIYREAYFLYDPDTTNSIYRQTVGIFIAHELAHMWFGNLVTPYWWDDLWLNEGFASYMEHVGTASVYPEWEMDADFLFSQLHPVFELDALTSSHPVYQPVSSPAQISEIFDLISYFKGASVVRMMRFFLGEDTYRKGVTAYLTDREYKAATHKELFDFLTAEARADGQDIDVASVMDTWILQMGYPVVTFSVDRDSGKITATQKRFLIDPNAQVTDTSPFNYEWIVPITLVTNQETDWTNPQVHWLRQKQMEISLTPGFDWIIANVEQGSYYRVNYDEDTWNRIINQLQTDHTKINPNNRAQLIDDAFNLGRAGIVSQALGFQVIKYLPSESHFAPWLTVSRNLGYIDKIMSSTGDYGYLRTYVQNIIEGIYNSLGWETTGTHNERKLRNTILADACHYGLGDCLERSRTLFQQWMTAHAAGQLNPIDANVRNIVYCYGIQEGGQTEWEFLFERFKESDSPSERNVFLSGLSCTQEDWILRRYFDKAMAEQDIRRQDFPVVVRRVSSSALGRTIGWQVLVENWDIIYERLKTAIYSLSSVGTDLTSYFSTNMELESVQRFIEETPELGSASLAFKQGVESIQSNINWRKVNQKTVADWLKEQIME